MAEEHHLKLVKSKQQILTEAILTLGALGSLYLASNPEILILIEQRFNTWKQTIAHRMSIWQTLVGIRTLPERDQPEP